MMDLTTIRQMADERAREAERKAMQPLTFFHPDLTTREVIDNHGGFPFIGSYEPEGWELRERHFVDSSGFGSPGEPALTQDEFIDKVRDLVSEHRGRVGFAVVEAGQFQVYVGEFHRTLPQEPMRLRTPREGGSRADRPMLAEEDA